VRYARLGIIVCILGIFASAGTALAHTSPEQFFNDHLDGVYYSYEWGHRHTLSEVSARGFNSQLNTEVCVNAYGDDGYAVGSFACTRLWSWPATDLAVHAYCNCAWRKGYVAISNLGAGRYIDARAQEKF
jgi:hypothetical protein